MNKKDLILRIQDELIKREKKIRNTNAIEQLVSFLESVPVIWQWVSWINKIYNIFSWAEESIEFEKMKITLDELIVLICALDEKISWVDKNYNDKINIILKDIYAKESVIWFRWKTSDKNVENIFHNNSLEINMSNIKSEKSVIWMDLIVDSRTELKQPLKIVNDFWIVQFNPWNWSRIIFWEWMN